MFQNSSFQSYKPQNIEFSGEFGTYGCFSSNSRDSFMLKNRLWKSVQHYFQAQKFADTKIEEMIRNAGSPDLAKKMGGQSWGMYTLRKDWDRVKDSIMYDAMVAKFSQNRDCLKVLLGTGSKRLIYKSTYDSYWGSGGSRSGKNRTGYLLMKLRERMRKKSATSQPRSNDFTSRKQNPVNKKKSGFLSKEIGGQQFYQYQSTKPRGFDNQGPYGKQWDDEELYPSKPKPPQYQQKRDIYKQPKPSYSQRSNWTDTKEPYVPKYNPGGGSINRRNDLLGNEQSEFQKKKESYLYESGPVLFYYETDPVYGCFSNYSPHKFVLGGKVWATSEHYFQAKKFADTRTEEDIRVMCVTPGEAKKMANSKMLAKKRTFNRYEWEKVKEKYMYEALKAKFSQNASIKKTLMGTGNRKLIENAPNDYYWGRGRNRTGKNRLGILLCMLRDEFKTRQQPMVGRDGMLVAKEQGMFQNEYRSSPGIMDPFKNDPFKPSAPKDLGMFGAETTDELRFDDYGSTVTQLPGMAPIPKNPMLSGITEIDLPRPKMKKKKRDMRNMYDFMDTSSDEDIDFTGGLTGGSSGLATGKGSYLDDDDDDFGLNLNMF